eukprot:186165-Chlamydomonas_euryale.AAC.1
MAGSQPGDHATIVSMRPSMKACTTLACSASAAALSASTCTPSAVTNCPSACGADRTVAGMSEISVGGAGVDFCRKRVLGLPVWDARDGVGDATGMGRRHVAVDVGGDFGVGGALLVGVVASAAN